MVARSGIEKLLHDHQVAFSAWRKANDMRMTEALKQTKTRTLTSEEKKNQELFSKLAKIFRDYEVGGHFIN